MHWINEFNFLSFIFFIIIYFYHNIYIIITLKTKIKKVDVTPDNLSKINRFAILIAARNEEIVISELLKSIHKQTYPLEQIDVYVIADNCTDNTASISRQLGAVVFERQSKTEIGKGFALDFGLKSIKQYNPQIEYAGYFIFDADNVLDYHYIYEMNKKFNAGYKILTSYRNSKNYGKNWITAGYGLWFLYESEYVNKPRMLLNTTCAISGTGCLISNEVIKKNDGWPYHLLTEDIQFSVSEALHGETIGYCDKAIFYDEQPTTFKQSWNQRLRWAKGFYQVFAAYGLKLLFKICRGNKSKGIRFLCSCYDLFISIAPIMLISVFCVIVNFVFLLTLQSSHALLANYFSVIYQNVIITIAFWYFILFFLGLITTITEWKSIHCTNVKKIFYMFTFPIFLATYFPISISALFINVSWKPIKHLDAKSLEEVIR